MTDAELAQGRIFPAAGRMRAVAIAIVTAVATEASDRGLATNPRPADLAGLVADAMDTPRYI